MKRLGFLLVFLWAGSVAGQDNTLSLDDDLLRSAEQWAKENLDEDALRVLQSADQEKVRKYLAEIQKQFHGEYVVDLAQLKDAAQTVLPLLESYEETLPYALWLKSRLDYLDVAEQFRLLVPPPKTEPGQPPKLPSNPPPPKGAGSLGSRAGRAALAKECPALRLCFETDFHRGEGSA